MDIPDELVQRAAQRDQGALQELLVRHLPQLQGWLRLRMGPVLRGNDSAIDLAQSVAREVLDDLQTFEWRGEAAFRHWLFSRAQHKLQDRIRHLHAQRRDPARLVHDDSILAQCHARIATPSADLATAEAIARIEQAFDALTEEQREAVSLYRICGLSHAEIAARTGRNESAVRNLVYRGLLRLSVQLTKLGESDHRRAPDGPAN